jgi:hypothetical protein
MTFRLPYRLTTACALWGLLGLTLFGAAPAGADVAAKPEAVATQPAPEAQEAVEDLRDPEAMAELKRATAFLAGLPRFQFAAVVAYDVIQKDGRRLQFEKQGEIFLQRPDRFSAEVRLDDGRHRQFWYDGKTVSIAEYSKKLHTQSKAPPTIDGMLDMLEGAFKDPMPLADLLYNDLGPLEERALEADIVGDALVDGRPCTHLAFRGETVDWQMWVEQGERPFIRKVAVVYRELSGVPQYVAWLDDWQTPEKFSADRFKFTVPADSEWIDLLLAPPQAGKEGGQP